MLVEHFWVVFLEEGSLQYTAQNLRFAFSPTKPVEVLLQK